MRRRPICFLPILLGRRTIRRRCWREIKRDDPALPIAALVACSPAVGSGDYALYHDIQRTLESCRNRVKDEKTEALLSLPEVLVTVNLTLPSMAPNWLKRGDFTLFPEHLRPFLLYLYALHLRNMGRHHEACAVAHTTRVFMQNEKTFTWLEIFFCQLCAGYAYYFGDTEEARRRLKEALDLGLPHGFIAPYAEWLTGYGGLMEDVLAREYPRLYKPALAHWTRVNKNWMGFRNRFTIENIATILTPQEQHAALLFARGKTYRQTAQTLNLSVGRVKGLISSCYEKLSISGREELKKRLLTY